MLDRFLVIAEANELPAILCVNKVELTGEAAARDLFDLYARIGYHPIADFIEYRFNRPAHLAGSFTSPGRLT